MQKFIFSESISYADVNSALESNGVVVIENFLNEDDCDAISRLLEGKQKTNSNELTFVQLHDSRFFSNALAVSKEAFNLVTKFEVIEISKNYLGPDVRLKCHRAYTTKRVFKFPWHTDNKFDGVKNDVYGIVFIVYLVDTFEGGTEFILGSHKFTTNFDSNNYFEEYVTKNFGNSVVKTSGKKGTVVISDTRTIHRGGYSLEKIVNRKSFWFQVEANMDSAEGLVLNPEFLPERPSILLSNYLGFGRKFGLKVHPVTTNNGNLLPFDYIISEFLRYGLLLLKIPPNWVRSKLSSDLRAKLKRLFLGSKVDWN
jgi:ectoine hydroxylase-related dioxygenase (phytanoyl-CoA dioxygenase family)